MVDEVPNATAAGTNHFPIIRFEAFRSRGAYEGLRGGQKPGEEGELGEGSYLSVGFDGGFAENGETRFSCD